MSIVGAEKAAVCAVNRLLTKFGILTGRWPEAVISVHKSDFGCETQKAYA